MTEFLDLIHEPVHSSWNDFLNEDIVIEVSGIEEEILRKDTKYTPAPERVFYFMTNDIDKAKVVIIGQDPYPQEGVATGRAFEVATLNDWNETFRNVSLKNIVRAVYHAYTGKFLTFTQIKQQLNVSLFNDGFSILPPGRLFKSWEQQGVLLLNTSFTCETGKPGSHSKMWNGFTRKLLSYVNERNPELIWFLWGNHAKSITSHLELRNVYMSNHPMICKQSDDDFLFGKVNMFAETKDIINWRGEKE